MSNEAVCYLIGLTPIAAPIFGFAMVAIIDWVRQ